MRPCAVLVSASSTRSLRSGSFGHHLGDSCPLWRGSPVDNSVFRVFGGHHLGDSCGVPR